MTNLFPQRNHRSAIVRGRRVSSEREVAGEDNLLPERVARALPKLEIRWNLELKRFVRLYFVHPLVVGLQQKL